MFTVYQLVQAALALLGCAWLYRFGYWRGLNRGLRARAARAWDDGHAAGTRQCVGLLARSPVPAVRAAALEVRRCIDFRP